MHSWRARNEWEFNRVGVLLKNTECVRSIKKKISKDYWVPKVLKTFSVLKEGALVTLEQLKHNKAFMQDSRGWRELMDLRRRLRLRSVEYDSIKCPYCFFHGKLKTLKVWRPSLWNTYLYKCLDWRCKFRWRVDSNGKKNLAIKIGVIKLE
jgi:hypothetical protein